MSGILNVLLALRTPPTITVDYLVVAGGGGSGSFISGGGGAGGYAFAYFSIFKNLEPHLRSLLAAAAQSTHRKQFCILPQQLLMAAVKGGITKLMVAMAVLAAAVAVSQEHLPLPELEELQQAVKVVMVELPHRTTVYGASGGGGASAAGSASSSGDGANGGNGSG